MKEGFSYAFFSDLLGAGRQAPGCGCECAPFVWSNTYWFHRCRHDGQVTGQPDQSCGCPATPSWSWSWSWQQQSWQQSWQQQSWQQRQQWFVFVVEVECKGCCSA